MVQMLFVSPAFFSHSRMGSLIPNETHASREWVFVTNFEPKFAWLQIHRGGIFTASASGRMIVGYTISRYSAALMAKLEVVSTL